MEKTYVIKGKIESSWVLVDAEGQGLGRLATLIAHYLLGKHKSEYTPGVKVGDFVVVTNVSRLRIPIKRLDEKVYNWHTGYPGGLKSVRLRDRMELHPDRAVSRAVWGMLPHNKHGRALMKRLKIYPGSEHPHEAQFPKPVE